MANKKIYINVFKDIYCWGDDKPTKGAIEFTTHYGKRGAIYGLFDFKIHYDEFSDLKFEQPLKPKKHYLYSLEMSELGVKKMDLMTSAKKKQKSLVKERLQKILKNQQKMSKSVNSNINKLLEILNK